MDWLMPPSVSAALDGLANLVAPTHEGFRVGSVSVPSGASVGVVADAVYAGWYLSGPVGAASAPGRWDLRRDMRPLLRAAHAGATSYEDGWIVLAVSDEGACLVGRDGEQRVVRLGDHAGRRRPAAPPAAGDEVAVSRRIDGVDPATGWWVTRSPAGEPEGPLGRLYLHPDARTAPRVLHAWTRRLLASDLTWSVKCLVDPSAYQRPDALVTYVPRGRAPTVRTLVTDLLGEAGHWLRPELPPLTEPLGGGASYADDPGDAQSFGQHVSRVLAPGVVALAADPERGPEGVQRLAATLAAGGIDPVRPWQGENGG